MGKGKVLKTTISLLGKIDPSLNRALSKAQKQSNNTGKSMSKSMKNAGAAMTKSVKGFAKTAVAVFASISAAAKLKQYAQECVTAAKAQIEAETKLETVLKNVESIQIRGPNAAVEAANNLKKVASEIQQTGVIGDEVLLAGMQQLATFQLDDSTISTLSTGMADLLAQQKGLNASQTDAVSVANMIGKVMSGSTSALSRIGITFTDAQEKLLKTGDATQRAATLAEVLQQNVGGVNKALALTDQGKLQQAENTIGDLKEQIGMKLLPIVANFATKAVPLIEVAFDKVGQVIDRISPHVENLVSKAMPMIGKAFDSIGPVLDRISPYIEKIASKAMPLISKAFDSIGPAFERIAPIAEEMFSFMVDSARQLEPVFTALGQSIMDGLGGKLPDITLMIQKLFSFIQAIVPVVITIIGIVGRALAPIVSALISVAQMILPKVMSLVQSLGSLFQSLSPILNFLGSLFGNVFGLLLRLVGAFVSGSIERLTMMINKLTGVIDFVKNFFAGGWREAWESVKSIFSNVWNSIKSIAHSALSAIVSPINSIISGINKVSGAVGIKAIPAIEIPQFAAGATVTRPTLAVVGEGRDPETIVPHNNKPRSRRLLADAAAGVGIPMEKISPVNGAISKINKVLGKVGKTTKKTVNVPELRKNVIELKPVFAVDGGNEDSESDTSYRYHPRTRNMLSNVSSGNSVVKRNSYTYAPVIYANNAQGVKEVLDDGFERFKEYMDRYHSDNDREVYA